MRARCLLVLPLALLALSPAASHGQTPSTPAPVPAPPAQPAPVPKAGKASLAVAGGVATEGMRYYAPGQQAVLRGRVRPAVSGEQLTLTIIRGGRASRQIRRSVRGGGRFAFRFKVRKPGLLRLVVAHAASPTQVAFRARAVRIKVVRWSAGADAEGMKVLVLQRALARLGYATPVSGYFDGLTANAVYAFRKANTMGRTGHASRSVYAMLLRGRGAFRLRYPKAGKHVEFDWSRQVLVLAARGRAYRVYHTSSGKASTPTVLGTYRFYRKAPGTNSVGMVHSSYFIRGYAIHGYPSVPNYPASHGCLRVPIPWAASIFRWIDLGDRILLYR